MPRRSDVPPETLRVSLEPEGVEVAYLDDRSVFYHGVPEKREGSVVCGPGRDVHVLVTAPDEREGAVIRTWTSRPGPQTTLSSRFSGTPW